MARVAPNLPAETDLLCEACGYTLNGLPAGANCPECGQPTELSVSPTVRKLPQWEQGDRAELASFIGTTAEVIFHPKRFYRSTLTRENTQRAATFGRIHFLIASILFGAAAVLHEGWELGLGGVAPMQLLSAVSVCFIFAVLTWACLTLTTRFAARLSAWEAAYRGIRLPLPVVLRGLYYHSAHYLPVAIIALATVAAYQFALWYRPLYWSAYMATYLYVLSGEVIVGAGYLFNTYWIGMRNMMYANY